MIINDLMLQLWTQATDWLFAVAPGFLKGLAVFAVGWYLAAKLKQFLVRLGARLKWEPTISDYLGTTLRIVAIAVFALAGLNKMGFPVTSLLATLGVSGVIIGLGLRGQLNNYFAGIAMLAARPFKKGDLIEFGPPPQFGVVRDVKLTFTTLDGLDNVRTIVPNGVLWRNRIFNFSTHTKRAINIAISIPYDVPVAWVKDIVFDVLNRNPTVRNDPPPRFTISDVTADNVRALVIAWCDVDSLNVFGDVITQMREQFEVAGLPVIVPCKDIDLKREE